MEKTVIKTANELEEFLKEFGTSFSFDTETTGLDYMKLEIEGISLCDGNKACYIDLLNNNDKLIIIDKLKQLFEEKAKTIVAHNIVFDMKVLYKYGISLEEFSGDNPNKKIYDTMIADHLIDENRSHALKSLAHEILGYDTMKYDEAEKAGHQSQTFYDYAINDAVWTWELCIWQQPTFKEDEKLLKLFREVEMPFQFCLFDMEVNGILVDTNKVKDIREDLRKAVNKFTEEMHDIVGERCCYQTKLDGKIDIVPTLNFNSSDTLAEILFNRLGLTVHEKTPTGKPKTGKEVIKRYKGTVKFVELLEKYKIAQKLLSSYFSEDGQIMRNLDDDGKVRANIIDIGTVSGRLSIQKPALQTLPKSNEDFPVPSRAAFIAGHGRKMFTVDFSGQENRVLADISNDPVLIEQLNNGWDAHLATANAAFGLQIPEECLNSSHPEHNKYKKKFKNERQKAKSINFALPYGGTEFAISKSMNVSKEEAKQAIDNYYKRYEKIKGAMDISKEEVKKYGVLETKFGRKRHFKKEENIYTKVYDYPDKAYRQALNFKIQSYSADMMRKAIIDTRKQFKNNPKWEAQMHITVHDELVCSCKEDYLEECSSKIKEVFENCVSLVVPVLADVGTGDNYDEAK